MTVNDHLQSARARLAAAGIEPAEAARDAALLARHALGWDAAALVTNQLDPVPATFAEAFDAFVARRAAREPVAYIRGVQEFWGRAFAVSPAVLIPRPETELIVEEALRITNPQSPVTRVADIGTGSGCLAVTLAAEWPDAEIVATDISTAALGVAWANAERHLVSDRVELREGPYLAGSPGPFDLIVSNPPYIVDADIPGLAPEVRDYEPASALAGGVDGLRDIREILRLAATALRPGGTLLMEIGHTQADEVRALATESEGLTLIDIVPDLQHIPRVASLQSTRRT